MKRLAIALVLLSGCASERILHAGESYCSSSDPKVCAELFSVAAQLHMPEANAAIDAARIPGKTQ